MSEFLGTASVLIVPDTTKFRAQLQAELTAATAKPIVVPVAPVVAGAGKGLAAATAETKALTVASTESAFAQRVLASAGLQASASAQLAGASAVKEAASLKVSAKAAAEAAAAHEAFARGAGASVLTLFGLRGATLAASAPFLAGTAAIVTAAKSVKEFSAETEAAARVERILGPELAKTSEEWAKQQEALGLSATAALKAEGAIAEVLHVVHLAPAEIAPMSQSLVKVAADIAAFNDVPVDTVLRALQLGISGNLRSLRQFGVIVRQADVAQEALRETGKSSTDELNRQDLVLARINLILRDTSNQTGSAARRYGDLAQQSKIAQSNLANLGAEIGGPLAHALTGDLILLNKFFDGLHKVGSGIGFLSDKIADAAHFLRDPLGRNADEAKSSLEGLQDPVSGLTATVPAMGAGIEGLVGPMNEARFAALATAAAIQEITTAGHQLLDLQFQGASSAQQIAKLQQIIDASRKVIAHPGKGGAAAREQARQERNQAQAQIKAIQAQDKATADSAAAAARSRASQVKTAANEQARLAGQARQDAQEKLDKADQAFLDALGLRRGAADIALSRAQATKGLQDDIKAQGAINALLRASIAAARKRINDVQSRKQTVQELTAALVQSNQAEAQLEQQEREAAAARRKLLEDRRGQRLDLRVEIAQTVENRNAEIAAREAKIRFDRELLKTVHGDILRALQLKLEIAQEEKAIKDLKKQVDDRNRAARSLEFSFLQEQQGFAATLLSNLLPVGAIRGTVGGAGGQSPPALGPGTALASAGAVAGAGGGATRGQAGAQLDVLRAIYGLLVGVAAGTRHPEAGYQRLAASANMSYSV